MQNRTASPSNSYDSSSDYSSEEEQERQMAEPEPEPSTSSEAPFSTQTPARVPPLGIGKLNLTHSQTSAPAQARSTHAYRPAAHPWHPSRGRCKQPAA